MQNATALRSRATAAGAALLTALSLGVAFAPPASAALSCDAPSLDWQDWYDGSDGWIVHTCTGTEQRTFTYQVDCMLPLTADPIIVRTIGAGTTRSFYNCGAGNPALGVSLV